MVTVWFTGTMQTVFIWPNGDLIWFSSGQILFWYVNSFRQTRWWLDLWTVLICPNGDPIWVFFWYYVNILTTWGLGFLVLCEQFWSDQMVNGLQTESPVPRFRSPSNVTFVLCVLQARGDRSARVAASQPPPCRWPSASSNPSTSAGCMSPPRSVAATIAPNLPTVGVKLPAVVVKLLKVAVKLPAVAVKLHTVAVKHPAVAVKLSSSSC